MKRPINFKWCALALLALSLTTAEAQNLVVPQIADGGGWQTTLVLTNTASSPASVSIAFFQDTVSGNTQNWNLPLLESVSLGNLFLPAAGTVFLHSAASASATTSGWAQIQTNSAVSAYAIFTLRSPGHSDQDGTSPATAASSRALIPYDNTGGHVTSVALVNPTSNSETITVGIQPTTGSSLQPTPIVLPAQGHMAFTMPQQFSTTGGQSGLVEFNATNGSIAGLALRSNSTGGLTTAPAYQESGPAIIGGGGSGGIQPKLVSMQISTDSSSSIGVSIAIVCAASALGCNAVVTATVGGPFLQGGEGFDSVTLSGNTLTFTGPEVVGSFMQDLNGHRAEVTSSSLSVTLNPQVVSTSGTVNGSVSLTSTLGTISGSFTGTYIAN